MGSCLESAFHYLNSMPIKFSEHALRRLKRRKISKKDVTEAVYKPEQVLKSYRGRKLRRRSIHGGILEVVTVTEGSRITVVTAYLLEEKI